MANPCRIKEPFLIRFVPNTIAFGGVATGSINALLHERAKTRAIGVGFNSCFILKAIIIGINIFADAVLEASSVKKIVKRIRIESIINILISPERFVMESAII